MAEPFSPAPRDKGGNMTKLNEFLGRNAIKLGVLAMTVGGILGIMAAYSLI
jgi:hypothetical protein